jgi:restriction system protein
MVTTDAQIPSYKDLLWPTLRAVREMGDSGTIEEIVEKVIELQGFSEEQQSVPHGDGPRSEIEYRLAWARTYLKGMGALINSTRGIWSTTELGRTMTKDQVASRHAEYLVELRAARRKKLKAAAESDGGGGDPEADGSAVVGDRDWKEKLLEAILAVPPVQFERLARRLLREAGFINATVTGKSGDGGIDGIGVYRLSLVSFPVFFQCKRYRGSVGAGAVRDFRGAMSGRGDKGLLITTGNFTTEAKRESTREGAPPIDLIDGERLCDLLKDYELGVRCTIRRVEEVEILPEFFGDL